MPRAKTPVHSPEVDAWFVASEHPLDAVLRADTCVNECITLKSPTFVYDANIASINPRARRFVQLMFHRGADIPGDFPHLIGGNGTAKYMTFTSPVELQERAAELEFVARA